MVGQAAIQIGVVAILARFVAPADFGLIAAANIVVTFVQIISEGGIGSAVVQREELPERVVSVALSVSLLVGMAFYVLLLGAAWPFQSLLGMQGLAAVVVALGFGAIIGGPVSVLEGVLQRQLRFGLLSRIALLSSALGYAVPALTLAAFGAGVWALVVATLLGGAVRLALLLLSYQGTLRPGWDRSTTRELLHFGAGLTHDRFWNWVTAQSGPFLIGLLFGQALLGQFYMASRLAVLPAQYLSSIVSAVYFPIMSRQLAGQDASRSGRFFELMAAVFVSLSGFGFLLAANAALVVLAAFGSGWGDAVLVFQILCLGAGIRSCIQISDSFNIAKGSVYALANRRAAAAIATAAGIFLARKAGLEGAAWATIAGQAAMLALTLSLAAGSAGLGRAEIGSVGRNAALATGLLGLASAAAYIVYKIGVVGQVGVLVLGLVANLLVLAPVAFLMSPRARALAFARLGIQPRSGGA